MGDELHRLYQRLDLSQDEVSALTADHATLRARVAELEQALSNAANALEATATWVDIETPKGRGWSGTVKAIRQDAAKARAALTPKGGET
jgi:hypothetical protein